MANNMYRVGDCVYFETSSAAPYQIRRIEELCKTPTGNVEAKVMSFYRRRDLSQNLISLADKHQMGGMEEDVGGGQGREALSERQRHQLKHRELFLSRQIETLPATHIRGKCLITLLNETELYSNYLHRDDWFFYSLVYDPQQKTLLADKGEIRVGPRFQADTPQLLNKGESDGRELSELEELVWTPLHSLSDHQIDNFLMLARSVGTFARSLDCSSTVKQPSLHMSAAAASRDVTLFQGMHILHRSGYEETRGMCQLVPPTGPVLCRDELEEWSSAEASIFEEALDKNGKDFFEIRNEALSWKTQKALVEYYYMWKTTDRYVQQKRIKAAEAESKLKQVYIPTYNKPNPAQIADRVDGRACESCSNATSNQWYSWGPAVMQGRVCVTCWSYWKKYGGLKMAAKMDDISAAGSNGHLNNNNNNTANNNTANNNTANTSNNNVASIINEKSSAAPSKVFKCSAPGCGKTDFRSKGQLLQHLTSMHGMPPSQAPCEDSSPVMKTRAAFCLVTTPLTRVSRQLCKPSLDIRRACRHPFLPINIPSVKQECQQRLSSMASSLRTLRPVRRSCMLDVSASLGIPPTTPKPPILLRPASKEGSRSLRKRPQEDQVCGPPTKIQATNTTHPLPTTTPSSKLPLIKHCLPKVRGLSRLKGVVRRMPGAVVDQVSFVASESSRQLRKQVSTVELKKAGRKPCKIINNNTINNTISNTINNTNSTSINPNNTISNTNSTSINPNNTISNTNITSINPNNTISNTNSTSINTNNTSINTNITSINTNNTSINTNSTNDTKTTNINNTSSNNTNNINSTTTNNTNNMNSNNIEASNEGAPKAAGVVVLD